MAMRASLIALFVAVLPLGACGASLTHADAAATREPQGADRLRRDALRIEALVNAPVAKRFVAATASLPRIAPRTLFHDREKKMYITANEAALLPPERGADLTKLIADETLYYETNYGSPLSYARPLDVLESHGVELEKVRTVFDFGYGYIGHLRLMTSLGWRVTGVDISPLLPALYAFPGDQDDGLHLIDGHFPSDPNTVAAVGGGYDLVISKNTLKRGYVHPDRPTEPKHRLQLDATDDEVLAAFFKALRPGGSMLIYNICPALTPPEKPFVPWSDGRSPFHEDQWQRAGFEVLAFDRDDTTALRQVARALGWGDNPQEWDIEHDLSVLYTLVRRPLR